MTLRTLIQKTPASAGKNRPNAQDQWLRHAAVCPIDELFVELNSSAEGLDSSQVDSARELYGGNAVSSPDSKPVSLRLLASFADPFTYILVFIAGVSVLTDWVFAQPGDRSITTPAIISFMILASGLLRFVQSERSTVAAASLAKMIEPCANVERDGDGGNETAVEQIVVGDVIRLSSGCVAPADMRIFSARDLFVSQASLTGESDSIEKLPFLSDAGEKCPVTGLDDLVLAGSTVISGHGRGVVVATGANTMIGEIAGSLASTPRKTSFDEGISSVSRLLVRLMATMVPIVFITSGITKGEWVDALLYSLSVAVGLTPEMLPMLVTCCLGKGAVDLSRDHVIVKRLDAIQDLGSINVLCCDKTGTLTEDRIVLERHLNVDGEEDERVLRFAYLNSNYSTGVKNLIDRAIIDYAGGRGAGEQGGQTVADYLCERYHGIDELPFDFTRRRLSVVVGDAEGSTTMITKGALDEMLSVCTQAEKGGELVPLTEATKQDVLAAARKLSADGMRVLGVAYKRNPSSVRQLSVDDESEMTLAGYLAFLDPPKPSAAAAIAALATHGVATKVLTGDSDAVASHVCRSLSLPVETVVTGEQVESMDDRELALAVQECSVFAKLTPSQKARVVRTLRGCGHAVGFMGDGVNDAPSMREADCGISVDSAVDVAREAADIILLEKDLMVLERGIECGRRTYANMIKYVKLTVSSNFGNILSMLVAAALLPFLPMTAVQVLLLNLIYDLSCTAIPWDRVDDESIRAPRRWDVKSIKSFMLLFGPQSSVFDIATFALLFFLICPAVAGGSWGTLSDAGRAVFVGTFQAGWFIESMLTQTLLVQLLRTERKPLVESRPALPLALMQTAGALVAVTLPFSPLASSLELHAIPAGGLAVLAAVVAGFVTTVLLARVAYARKHDSLL